MALCVEAYIGEEDGKEGVKLEDQVTIIEQGVENLTNFPFESVLLEDWNVCFAGALKKCEYALLSRHSRTCSEAEHLLIKVTGESTI